MEVKKTLKKQKIILSITLALAFALCAAVSAAPLFNMQVSAGPTDVFHPGESVYYDVSITNNAGKDEIVYLDSDIPSQITPSYILSDSAAKQPYNNEITIYLNPGQTKKIEYHGIVNPDTTESVTPTFSLYYANGETKSYDQTIVQSNLIKANSPPVANAGGPYTVNEGQSFTIDASKSYDADGDVLWYTYDYTVSNTNSIPTTTNKETFPAPPAGTYPIKVTVDDKNGGVSTASTTLTVQNVAPIVNIGSDMSIKLGNAITVSGSYSDPGNDVSSVSWDFGDGSGVTSAVTDGTPKTVKETHTYTKTGIYPVKLTVKDSNGGVTSKTMKVTVNPQAVPLQTLIKNPKLIVAVIGQYINLILSAFNQISQPAK